MSAVPPSSRLWLALGPGTSRHELREELAAHGYTLIHEQPRGAAQFFTWRFVRAAPGPSQDPHVTEAEIGYQEDHLLGQRLIWIATPTTEALAALGIWLRNRWATKTLPELTETAERAELAQDKVRGLAAWAALAACHGELDPVGVAMLRSRLEDASPAVRQAAVMSASYFEAADVTELLAAHRNDPQLAVEIERQLALRGWQSVHGVEAARVRLEDAIAASPLDPELYVQHAQVLASLGQPNFALLEAQIGLALARRAGFPLHDLQALTAVLQQQATPPSQPFVTFLAGRLALLLSLAQPHVVVEVSELLQPAWPGEDAQLPLLLAQALAHRLLQRPALAASQLGSLLEMLQSAALRDLAAQEPATLTALLFVRAQLLCELAATDEAISAGEQALGWLSTRAATVSPAAGAAWAPALAALLAAEPAPDRRALLFFCLQLHAVAGRYAEALAVAQLLLADEPDAADVHLARATLLNQQQQPEAALQACEQGQASLRPLDRLLEDEDPLAALLLQRALAWVRLAQPDLAAECLCTALRCDPRCAAQIVEEGLFSSLLIDSSALQEQLAVATLAGTDPDPRTQARQAAADCLLQLPRGTALAALLLDFFAAVLAILDTGPSPAQLPAAMGLLSSVEAQLDVLAESGEAAAHSPAVNAAIAAMADALGL